MLQGFSMTELLVTITLMASMAALSLPAWKWVARIRSKHAGVDAVVISVDRARSRALTMKEDAWVVFAHPGGKKRDALRLVIKEGGQFSPVGPWLQLPQGITFHIGGNTLMGESPPSEILLAACNGTPAQQDCSYGGLLFRGSERIALPRQGGNQLSLQLDPAWGSAPDHITFSRATGRALCR
jgi:prepilin-type N-terminal cleavage/methylation domain-containing protein